MIQLCRDAIDPAPLIKRAQSRRAGAVLLFLGVTRQMTEGRETSELRYEAYEAMAATELERLEREACERWALTECIVVHRLGVVPLGDASVAIVTASAHRRAAFEAGEWLIDTLKQAVPIWKQECWADGQKEWIHPEPANGPAFPSNPSPPCKSN